jgi:hypothetical protein
MGITAWGTGAVAGDLVRFEADAPPGLAIIAAQVGMAWVLNVNNGQGWGGGSYWAGGGRGWYDGQVFANEGLFNSSYYGFQLICGWAHCTNRGAILLNSAQLTALETTGPSLTAVGSNNLWYQGGRWLRNHNGDGGWPITLYASDPSGVCSMWAIANGVRIDSPSQTKDTSQWHQCPDWTWTPDLGAVIDTRQYVPTAGPLSLELHARNGPKSRARCQRRCPWTTTPWASR